MKKLTNLLKESKFTPQLGKVYSNPMATSFVKENEEEREVNVKLSDEQKAAFFEAVKQYRKFGESVYRNAGLSEVYEAIKGLVETANKVTLSETGDWFDGVTVSRHMKRMGESFKVFEKTLKEVGTLQQRLESSYDEIGEVLGKYYEINESEEEMDEGNEFGAARAKAIAAGNDSFEVDGKTYPVKDVDKDDKENAKEFSNESMKLTDMIKGKLVNESPSSEEIRIAMLAVNKQKKYRQVPPSQAVTDVQNALDVIDRDIKKGKIKDESVNEAGDFAGWVAIFNGKKLEIDKSQAKDLYNAKLFAIKTLKVPKSKVGMLAIKPAVSEAVVNEAKYDIGMARKGNGITIYNKAEEEAGDYKNVAHISDNGVVKYYDKKLPSNIKKQIEAEASKMKESVNEGRKSKDAAGVRFAEAVYNNVHAIGELVVRDKRDPNEVISTFGPVLLNAINACLKHNYKPNPTPAFTLKSNGDISNQERIDIFKKSLMELKKIVEALIKKPSKVGVKSLVITHRDWWNHNYGANIALNGEGAHHNTIIESVKEGTKMIKLKNLLNESFGFGELPSSKLMKMKVSAKDMLASVGKKKVNEVSEEEDVVEEGRASAKSLLQSVIKGESSRIEGIKLSKKAAEGLLDWLMVSPYGKKFPNLPFHMLLKASFNWGLSRHLDKNSKEYKDLQAVAKTLEKK